MHVCVQALWLGGGASPSPVEHNNEKKMHTSIQQVTDKPIVIILKIKLQLFKAHEQNKFGGNRAHFAFFVNVAINFTAWSTPHPSDLPCSAGPAAEGTC